MKKGKLSHNQISEIAHLYEVKATSISFLGKQFEVSGATVRYHLRKAGIYIKKKTLPARSLFFKKHNKKHDKEYDEEANFPKSYREYLKRYHKRLLFARQHNDLHK